MFSIVYVLLPLSDDTPAEAIASSLARYERGARGEVPEDWLVFDDATAGLLTIHQQASVAAGDRSGFVIEGGDSWYLDLNAVETELKARDAGDRGVRFFELEPDFDLFVERFARPLERHPATGDYGRWLNGLGKWDWWDLGGRFDGRITGRSRSHERSASAISSGPSLGRRVLQNVQAAFKQATGHARSVETVLRADDNVEMASWLGEKTRQGRPGALPGAILLPPGSVGDEPRWLDSWPTVAPAPTVAWLGLQPAASWKDVAIAAYDRFPEHWVAGVASHL